MNKPKNKNKLRHDVGYPNSGFWPKRDDNSLLQSKYYDKIAHRSLPELFDLFVHSLSVFFVGRQQLLVHIGETFRLGRAALTSSLQHTHTQQLDSNSNSRRFVWGTW